MSCLGFRRHNPSHSSGSTGGGGTSSGGVGVDVESYDSDSDSEDAVSRGQIPGIENFILSVVLVLYVYMQQQHLPHPSWFASCLTTCIVLWVYTVLLRLAAAGDHNQQCNERHR